MTNSELNIPSLQEENLMFHCFLAFSYLDESLATELDDYLLKRGLSVGICSRFKLGKLIVQNIEEAVEKSRRVVIILSKNYLNSRWYEFETLLCIHNTVKHKKQMIITMLVDMEHKDVPSRLSMYNYKIYKPEKREDVFEEIAQAVVDVDVPMEVSLPCGDVANGLVWSYYYGYLKLILPGTRQRCEESEWWKENLDERRMASKIIIIVPVDGFCPRTLTDMDPNITTEGHLKPFTACRAGVVGREYKNTVYRIEVDGEVYFAPCECATPVVSMYDMARENIAGFSEEEKLHQIRQFISKLDSLLSHITATDSLSVYAIIAYEGGQSLSQDIMKIIKQSLADEKKLRARFDENKELTAEIEQCNLGAK